MLLFMIAFFVIYIPVTALLAGKVTELTARVKPKTAFCLLIATAGQ
jgi:hypothetical protein